MLASKFILTLFAIAAMVTSAFARITYVRRSLDLTYNNGEAAPAIVTRGEIPFHLEHDEDADRVIITRGETPFRREYYDDHVLVARAGDVVLNKGPVTVQRSNALAPNKAKPAPPPAPAPPTSVFGRIASAGRSAWNWLTGSKSG